MWKIIGICLVSMLLAGAKDLSGISHPRLWFPKDAEAGFSKKLVDDPLVARMQTAIMIEADRVLKARTCRYEIPDGKRLLAESRLACHNVMHSAWAWRISADEKFRLRAIAELEAACALKDWNPSHFLDTAEMAAAVATGYDWLYPTLTADQRAMCERAIIEKALKPAKAVYDKAGWWSNPRNNWSQVCGSGIALAAIAIAGKDEGLSSGLIDRGIKLIEKCAKFYQPDGMYPEGPGYWQYGTNYHVMLLAACQSLNLTLEEDDVLRKAGDSIMHLEGPTGMMFNFADGGADRNMQSPAQCWLAARYHDATQARHVRASLDNALIAAGKKGGISGDRWFPLAALWLPESPPKQEHPPLAAVFHGEQSVALFRTGWEPDSAWLAIKGGTPAASHGHMDAGSFCYDAHGLRWIHDMGKENYNLPAYFGKKRWTYFRLKNRSHNTLEIDGKLQNPHSKPCNLTDSGVTGTCFSASFDLTDAYAGSADQIVRSVAFDSRTGKARITDEILAPAGNICWRAYTDAEAVVSGNQVFLSKKGKQIILCDVSGKGVWTITDAKPPNPKENQNDGFRSLVLTVPKSAQVSCVVEIQP